MRRATKFLSPAPSGDRAPLPLRAAEYRGYLQRLEADPASREYLQRHLDRLVRTLTLVPAPGPDGRVLELGCYMQMTPALKQITGYTEVAGAYYGAAGQSGEQAARMEGKEVFRCRIDLFDAEKDRFPYPDSHFELVLACEILEHLLRDPMHMLIEIHRILHDGGRLILTTPNCASHTSLARLLHGRGNPQMFSCYSRRAPDDAPHVREYAAHEVGDTLRSAGFEIEWLFTEPIAGFEEGKWVSGFLAEHGFETGLRGEQTYCVARKRPGFPVERYPAFLYTS